MATTSKSLYERIGGRATLEQVHKIFYDKVYEDSFMSRFFGNINQEDIEKQQSDFMSSAMGGPKVYSGHTVAKVHKHIYITEAVFAARHVMLRDSIREAGLDIELAKEWIRIDSAFKNSLIKNKEDCEGRYTQHAMMLFADEYDPVT